MVTISFSDIERYLCYRCRNKLAEGHRHGAPVCQDCAERGGYTLEPDPVPTPVKKAYRSLWDTRCDACVRAGCKGCDGV